MRITIGDPKTKKFSHMFEVYYAYSTYSNDNSIYVVDHYGRYITLIFPDRKTMVDALSELRDRGYTTTYCETEYHQPSDQERELDPYIDQSLDDLFEERER